MSERFTIKQAAALTGRAVQTIHYHFNRGNLQGIFSGAPGVPHEIDAESLARFIRLRCK